MKDLENKKFRNFYRCSECGTEWQDEWDSTSDVLPRLKSWAFPLTVVSFYAA